MDETNNYFYGFRDFVIDLFGKMMPGMLFLVFSLVALSWPIYALVSGAGDPTNTLLSAAINSGENLSKLIEAAWVSLTLFILFLAYSIGHMFYRSDIKKPDTISLKRMLAEGKLKGDEARSDFACVEIENNEYEKTYFSRMLFFIGKDIKKIVSLFVGPSAQLMSHSTYCEYPYLYLYDYLEKRGLAEALKGLIPWKDNPKLRSKNYINILKIRIAKKDPELYMKVTRNEAHVRLSSSIWHVARVLQWTATIGLLILFFAVLINEHNNQNIENSLYFKFYFVHAITPLFVILISAFCRSVITGFLHQQRIREAVYVLEIAHCLFKDDRGAIIDIFPDYTK